MYSNRFGDRLVVLRAVSTALEATTIDPPPAPCRAATLGSYIRQNPPRALRGKHAVIFHRMWAQALPTIPQPAPGPALPPSPSTPIPTTNPAGQICSSTLRGGVLTPIRGVDGGILHGNLVWTNVYLSTKLQY